MIAVASIVQIRAQNEAQMAEGKLVYATCMACHGADGKGIAAGPSKMAPAFVESRIVNGDPSILALVVLKGVAKEGQDYLGMMTPMEGAIPTDDKLAAILTYIRGSFGNKSAPVSAAEAKMFRDKWKEIKASVTRAKLKELNDAAKK